MLNISDIKSQTFAMHKMANVAFADTLDRLEILLQEARHAQENIIYCLREPMFSRALRFEELMLWDPDISESVLDAYLGRSADQWFPKGDSSLIARNCTIVFPTYKQALGRIKITEQVILNTIRDELAKHEMWKKIVSDIKARIRSYQELKEEEIIQEEERIIGIGLRVTLRAYYLWSCKPGNKSFAYGLKQWLEVEGSVYLNNLAAILFPQKNDTPPLLLSAYQTACVLQLELSQLIVKIWTRGDWSDEQKRYYFNLIALQQIKRDIVRDRLLLVTEGWSCVGKAPEDLSVANIPRFLLLRSALTARIESYIARIGDCQELFNKSQDTGMGLNEFPHPSGERRREQRLYDAYLTNRCMSTWNELNRLIQHMGGQKSCPPGHVQHRWAHDFPSKYVRYESAVDKHAMHRPYASDEFAPGPRPLHFVNSSYYMPDRPDIQALISHEVAHAFIQELFGPINSVSLQTKEPFFNLLRAITRTIMETKDSRGNLLLTYPAPEELVEEIAADLLTGAIQGPAYLWALFLETLGRDLDEAFLTGSSSEPDPTLIDHITGFHFQAHSRGPWYLRLKTLCGWLRDINDSIGMRNTAIKIDEAEEFLITGVEGLIDSLQRYLDDIGSQYSATDGYKPESEQWIGLGRRLQRAVSGSYVVDRAAEWRGALLEAAFLPKGNIHQPILKKVLSGMRVSHAPKALTPLSQIARDLIYKAMTIDKASNPLKFCTSRDVPWQVASHECFNLSFPNRTPTAYASSSVYAFSRMRELHMYALEWDIATSDPVGSTLEGLNHATCSTLRALNHCKRSKGQKELDSAEEKDPYKKILADWLGCDLCPDHGPWLSMQNQRNMKGSQAVIDLICKIIAITATDINQSKQQLGELPALAMRATFCHPSFMSTTAGRGVARQQSLERLMLTKISDLKLPPKNQYATVPAQIKALMDYAKTVSQVIEQSPDSVFLEIATAIETFSWSAISTPPPSAIAPLALGRLCFAGMHRMLKPDIRDHLTSLHAKEMREYNKKPQVNLAPQQETKPIAPPLRETSVMGHYDRLIVAAPNTSNRHAPRFHEDTAKQTPNRIIELLTESFLPYHTRWEWAIPMRLNSKTKPDEDAQPLAYISIVLKKPAGRLFFIERLLNSVCTAKNGCGNDTIGEFITDNDILWLCDSWQDIMLEIQDSAGCMSRLHEIFKIKNAFHNDPQVQNVEIIFSSVALNILCDDGEHFDARIAFRIDRRFGLPADDLANNIQNEINAMTGFTLSEIGRRLDFAFYFNSKPGERKAHYKSLMDKNGEENLHAAILDFLSTPIEGIDKFQTDMYGISTEVMLLMPLVE